MGVKKTTNNTGFKTEARRLPASRRRGPGPGPGPGGPRHGALVEKAEDARGTALRIWDYMVHEKKVMVVILVLVIVSSILNLVGPYLIGVAIDDYIGPGDLHGLIVLCGVLIGAYGIGSFGTWLQNYLMIGVGQKTVHQMRKDVFTKVQKLPLHFFDTKHHGELMSRLTNDVEHISRILSMNITQMASSVVRLIISLGMMMWLSPMLTFISIMIIPVMIFTTKKIARYTRKYFLDEQINLGQLNGFVEETVTGQRVVKVFCHEDKAYEQFEEGNERLRDISIKAQMFAGIIMPIMQVFNNASLAIVASVGGWLAIQGVLTIGAIVSFVNYFRQSFRPINELANQFNMIQSALAGAERLFEIIDEPPETEEENASVLENIKGEVSFRDVNFAYEEDTPVLKNFTLNVNPGDTIALVGPTGAGKTTVVNLLTRFYDIDSGKIYIDGQDINRVHRDNIRSLLGIVLQDTYLFSGSIKENIRYGRLDATDEEVTAAAKLAYADQFIRRLPQGYDTILTDDGGSLSQGQRQLLSISRAILADPAILILDEATSSVDTRTEVHIQKAMLNLMKGRTSFVIAHRLSTIRDADKIVVIDNGEIIEQGNHQELLDKKGFYYNLCKYQFSRGVTDIDDMMQNNSTEETG